MIAARENPTVKTYTVAGKTLADIWKDIQKKGPVDPNEGKRYAGSCLGAFSIGLTDKDLAFEVTPGSSPVEVKAQLAEGKGKVTSKPAITMPKLGSDKTLSAAAKKEWGRFADCTSIHEYGHADSLYLVVIDIAKDISGMTATATGANEKAAKTAAGKALFAKIDAAYGRTKLADLVKDDIKAYDDKTRHGETQGAKLDTSIV
jgi:predicted secreted Zn-dependent protease